MPPYRQQDKIGEMEKEHIGTKKEDMRLEIIERMKHQFRMNEGRYEMKEEMKGGIKGGMKEETNEGRYGGKKK